MPLPLEFNSTRPRPAKPAVRYRALNSLAVTSVVLGVLSLLTALASTGSSWLLLTLIPLAGVVVGWRAVKQVRKAPDEWTGLKLAWLGIVLSAGLWAAGSAWVLLASASEVPFGYAPIAYEDLQPDPQTPTMPIPQSALDMQDKKVFLRGYMQPRRQQTHIKEFILCPTNGECPFCNPSPKRTEMIRVILQGDLEAAYTAQLIRVAGRFRVDPQDPGGVPYGLEADYLR
jgi:hypothetical protein